MDFGSKMAKTRFLARAEITVQNVLCLYCYREICIDVKKSAFLGRAFFFVFFKKWSIFEPLFDQKRGNTYAMGRYPLGVQSAPKRGQVPGPKPRSFERFWSKRWSKKWVRKWVQKGHPMVSNHGYFDRSTRSTRSTRSRVGRSICRHPSGTKMWGRER